MQLSFRKKPEKSPIYVFTLKETKISKKFRQYKKKNVFGLLNGGKKYLVGFSTESGCDRIHSIIRSIMKEKECAKERRQNEIS